MKKTAKKKTAKRAAKKSAPKRSAKKAPAKRSTKSAAKNPRAKVAAPGRKRPSAKARAAKTVKRQAKPKPPIEEQTAQEIPPFEDGDSIRDEIAKPAGGDEDSISDRITNPVGSLEDDLAREVEKMPIPAEGKCFKCGKPTGKDGFCYGCKAFICENCDEAAKSGGLFGKHEPDDHLLDPDLLGDDDPLQDPGASDD